MDFCHFLPIRKTSKSSNKQKPKEKIEDSFVFYSAKNTKEKVRKPGVLISEKVKKVYDASICSIFHIDKKIKEEFKSRSKKLNKKYEKFFNLFSILKKTKDPGYIHEIKNKIKIMRNEIRLIENKVKLGIYLIKSYNLLEKYNSISNEIGEICFVRISEDKNKKLKEKLDKIKIKYFQIAKEYTRIKNIPMYKNIIECKECKSTEFEVLDDNSTLACTKCALIREMLDNNPSFKDTDRVNMSSKYTYTKKGHFVDAMKKFQGIQNSDPIKIASTVKILEREMKNHRLTGERGKKNSIQKEHIHLFLSEQKLSNHYEDIHLLFHVITGEPCPDISHLEEILCKDFDKFEKAYEIVKDPNRINSLNVHFKLYKLLQRRGFPCKKSDFHILKTKEKKDEHDFEIKKAFDLLEWEWIPTF